MARVPDYSLPQEKEAPFPSARVETIASPALLDAGAEELGRFGKAVEGAGIGVAQVAYHMQQRENADVLFTTEAADKAAYLAYEADLRDKRQGNNAKGAASDTATWWKERISKNIEGMNPEQQRTYTQRISAVQLQAIHNVSQFESHQTEVAHDQSWAADKINTINLAAATPTPGVVDTSVREIKKMNAYQGARKGWDAKVLQAENGKDITMLHTQAIQTLAKDNPTLAEVYYKEHEQEIDGSRRAEVGDFAKKATSAKLGADAAEEVWNAQGPKGDNDAASVDVMAKTLRERFKNDPYTRDVALKQLHEMDATRDKAIRARDTQRTATVNSLLMGGASLAAVQQTSAWAALDGTEQRKIIEHEESIGAAREGRALAKQLRAEHEKELAGLDTMLRLSDPDKLVAMSRNEVINLRTTLGNKNTEALLSKWDAYTKNGTLLSEGKLDHDQFNAFAVRAGLDPNSKDDTMKKRVVDTRDKVERIIGSEQQTKKRPLTREEKDKILQQQIDNAVIQHNLILLDKAVPAITLPDDKQASAYVVVNGQEVKLATIPMDYRTELIAARRARGLPTSEKVIAEMWLKKQAAQKSQLRAKRIGDDEANPEPVVMP